MLYTLPDDYKQFSCIAGNCEDTCCAGWQIVIDERSLARYKNVKSDFGKRLHKSIHWRQKIFKQDKEKRFWNLFNGGKIQYVRYPLDYNKEAIRSLVNRAMEIGFYEGVNLDLCYCNACGYSAVEMNGTCPKCGSHKITQVDRMNGYLGITRNADGSSRYNDAKLAEIAERRSM